MTAPTSASRSGELFPWFVLLLAGAVTLAWAGGCLAIALAGTPRLLGLPDAGVALGRLPARMTDPASAWPHAIGVLMPGPVMYWIAQLVALIVGVGAVAASVRVWRSMLSDRPRPMGVLAEAGFARRRDLRDLRVPAPAEGRLTVGRSGGALVACERDASLAVIGPTGCGKTAGFAIPALLEWRGPVLATSVKADLLQATERHRRSRGKVWIYDPTSSAVAAPSEWSPLDSCRTWRDAQRLAAWMVEAAQPRQDTVNDSDYWYTQARKGLAPYLLAAATAEFGIKELATWVDTQEEKAVTDALRSAAEPSGAPWDDLWDRTISMTRDLLATASDSRADLAEQPTDEWPAWLLERVRATAEDEWRIEQDAQGEDQSDAGAPLIAARALWSKESRLRGSVFATMENVLSAWADPGVGRSGRTNEIDLDDWLAGDNTIYVVAPAHEQARLRPVLTVLVQQAIRRAYDTASANGGRLPHPSLVLLDEAGNIAPLRDLPGYASTARSHGITFVTVWQDVAQIRAIYHDRADTVLNNHRAKLFGSGIADTGTLEYASRLIGDEPRTERNVSFDVNAGRRSLSEHRTYRSAASVDVLRRIHTGEGLLLYGRELPAHVRLRPWFADAGLRRLGEPQEVTCAGVRR
jgi:type IV secretion system protein VirD4